MCWMTSFKDDPFFIRENKNHSVDLSITVSRIFWACVNFTIISWAAFVPVDLGGSFWCMVWSIQHKSWQYLLVVSISKVGCSFVSETEFLLVFAITAIYFIVFKWRQNMSTPKHYYIKNVLNACINWFLIINLNW